MDTTKPLIYIEWVDAVADNGWASGSKAEVHDCKTVGFLIDETDQAICIASTVSMSDTNARMHIHKAWIKNRRRLSIETKQRKSKGKNLPAVGKGPDNRGVQY